MAQRRIKKLARINVLMTKTEKTEFIKACKFNGDTISEALRGHIKKVITKTAKDKAALKSPLEAQKNANEVENTSQGELIL